MHSNDKQERVYKIVNLMTLEVGVLVLRYGNILRCSNIVLMTKELSAKIVKYWSWVSCARAWPYVIIVNMHHLLLYQYTAQ